MTEGPVGRPVAELDTPALLIDLPAFERNLAAMRDLAARAGIAYRPHAKAHKSPVVAGLQQAHGARGVCCAKLGEAEALADGGVADVLITGEVVGAPKLRRLVALARRARVAVVADHPDGVAALSGAATSAGITLDVLVEVDVGQGRCGTPPGAPAVALAERVARSPGLRFRGFQGYHGAIQMLADFGRRAAEVRAAAARLGETAEAARKAGLPVEVLTGGGTGTAALDVAAGVLTELQPGSYVFMDTNYAAIAWDQAGAPPPFARALSVRATVVSRPARERAVVDAGLKALSSDGGLPAPKDAPGAAFAFGGDEHGILRFDGACPLDLGAQVELYPSHCDTTVNLHDRFFAVRGGVVEAVWEITGRGRTQ
jgi:3-hydroxy-D-aspartate aldolase